ncbi:hypothetical protein GOP47_0017629 [Adiantum capillus-veneris]|uniref:Phytocyanin domain-containing protein n=1 Tax=Adiantum capillus-veneris TaxID=13818 RepID=A0A9D4UFQ9_ADICA|nr:hypothetical protein GOP47_0017629 [Adiantum capillus-veneris]
MVAVLVVIVASTIASCSRPAADAISQHIVVGEQEGWTLPPGSSGQLNYSWWVHQRAFHVGDILVFEYQPDLHDVLLVEKDDYENCNTSAPLVRYSNGNTSIRLEKSGVWYFICGLLDHCAFGQKLAVTCLDPTPSKQLPSINPPISTPPPSTSFPNFPSMPPTPNLDRPSPSNSYPPYFDPAPPTSNTPFATPNPFVNSPPPLTPTIDPSSPSSCPSNVPPPFVSPPTISTPCVCQVLPPPPPPLTLSPSPPTPITLPPPPSSNLSPPPPPSNLSPLVPSSNFSPSLNPNPKACVAILINAYLLFETLTARVQFIEGNN